MHDGGSIVAEEFKHFDGLVDWKNFEKAHKMTVEETQLNQAPHLLRLNIWTKPTKPSHIYAFSNDKPSYSALVGHFTFDTL